MLIIEKQFVNSDLMSNYLVYECKNVKTSLGIVAGTAEASRL